MTPEPDQSVLLIHAGAIGDFVLALALLKGLKAAWPNAKLHALCRCRLACFFARRGFLAGWKHLEQPTYLPLFSSDLPADPGLRSYLNSFNAIITMLGDADAPTSQHLRRLTQSDLFCIDPVLRQATEQQQLHITDQWLSDLADQGLRIPRELATRNSELSTHYSARVSGASAENRILIHPGSGGLAKCWPLENFEALAERFRAARMGVHFMIGPAEVERFDEESRQRLTRTCPVLYEEDVCDAAEHVAGAAVFIGNDAGLTHLAAFLGVPTVAIFTATDPAIWQPIGAKVSIIDARDDAPSPIDRVLNIVRRVTTACSHHS